MVKVTELWDGFYRSSIAGGSDHVVICEEYLCLFDPSVGADYVASSRLSYSSHICSSARGGSGISCTGRGRCLPGQQINFTLVILQSVMVCGSSDRS